MTDEPLVPWKEIAAQSIDRTEALEAERDGFRAEVGLLLLSVKTFEAERDELRAEIERLRAELTCWKPANCGKIYPVPVAGEAVEYCTREPDHDGPHQAESGLVWVFPGG